MRVLLIVNTTASAVTARRRVRIQRALSADHRLEVTETSRRGHAARIARGAAYDGVDVVAVLAGDGTLNEAADGLAGTRTALAPLPGGSTNVFARTIGVSADPVEATNQLVHSLERRSFLRIGIGVANGRRFLFHLGAGFDAAVIHQVERRSTLKRHAAHALFIFYAFNTWFRHYDRSIRFDIKADDEDLATGAYVVVSNTSPYTYLGSRPLIINPHAGLDRALAITMFRDLSIGALIPATISALGQARLTERHPRIEMRSDVTRLTIAGDREFAWQVDGDYLGLVSHLDVHYEPEALTIVLP